MEHATKGNESPQSARNMAFKTAQSSEKSPQTRSLLLGSITAEILLTQVQAVSVGVEGKGETEPMPRAEDAKKAKKDK